MRNFQRRLEHAGNSNDRSGIGWAVETYTTEPGKADRLTGKLSVVDFESALRKFLPLLAEQGKRWKKVIRITPPNCVLVSDRERGTLIEPSKTGGKSLKL